MFLFISNKLKSSLAPKEASITDDGDGMTYSPLHHLDLCFEEKDRHMLRSCFFGPECW